MNSSYGTTDFSSASTSSGLQEGVGDGSGVDVSVAVGMSVFVDVGTRVGVLVGGGVSVGVGDGASEPHEVMQRQAIIARGRVDLYLIMIDYLPSRFLLNHRGIVSAAYQQLLSHRFVYRRGSP